MKEAISTKQTIVVFAVMAFLTIGAFFMANVELPSWSSYLSPVNVVLFAIPAFWAARWWLGWKDSILLFLVLGVLALVIETSAIITGFPYGHFGYSQLLGYKLFGYVPWTIFLAWTPLVIAAYAIAARLFDYVIVRILSTAVLLVVFDLVLDPGAVKLGFWRYDGGGEFYGVPFTNFVGWLISGAVAAVVLEIFVRAKRPLLRAPAQLISSAFFVIFFWTAITFFSAMVAPALIGVVVLVSLAAFYIRFYYAFDDMIVYVDEQDNVLATAPKLAAHNSDTKLHRAFSVFLFNSKGELLLQQRALSKKTWPGVWSNSCCGHVMLHETVEHAAKRRLSHELGIRVDKLHLVLPDFRYRAEKDGVVENEICPVFVGCTSALPVANPDEVNDVKWVAWRKFIAEVADPANGYSPWAREEVELLAGTSSEYLPAA
ncbi:MAG: isopentenyl-diphosphate Delta-isomerase [Pyrinomonadaceae bacterium]